MTLLDRLADILVGRCQRIIVISILNKAWAPVGLTMASPMLLLFANEQLRIFSSNDFVFGVDLRLY